MLGTAKERDPTAPAARTSRMYDVGVLVNKSRSTLEEGIATGSQIARLQGPVNGLDLAGLDQLAPSPDGKIFNPLGLV